MLTGSGWWFTDRKIIFLSDQTKYEKMFLREVFVQVISNSHSE